VVETAVKGRGTLNGHCDICSLVCTWVIDGVLFYIEDTRRRIEQRVSFSERWSAWAIRLLDRLYPYEHIDVMVPASVY